MRYSRKSETGIYHQEWRNKPVHYNAEANLDPDLTFPENQMKRLIFDFA